MDAARPYHASHRSRCTSCARKRPLRAWRLALGACHVLVHFRKLGTRHSKDSGSSQLANTCPGGLDGKSCLGLDLDLDLDLDFIMSTSTSAILILIRIVTLTVAWIIDHLINLLSLSFPLSLPLIFLPGRT